MHSPHFAWLPHLPVPVLVMGLVGCALLIGFGLLYDRGIGRAEDRAELREFRTEMVETVTLPAEDGWVPGHGTEHFFGVSTVAYDPEADAAVFMEKMDRDVQDFLAQLVAA